MWLSRCNLLPTAPLFSLDGSPLSYNSFHKALRKVLLRASIIDKISSHSFRKGGATFLSIIGMPIEKIKERGGWSSNAVFKYISESLDLMLKLSVMVKLLKLWIDIIPTPFWFGVFG